MTHVSLPIYEYLPTDICILRSPSEHDCLAGSHRQILGVLQPRNQDEVQACLSAARKTKTTLYPISTGMNWGLGSGNPVGDNCVILDLSKMNRIIEINHELGYARIEPGVTQAQLAAELKRTKSPFFIDVTGSSADSSILGNALDRGVAYNQLRVDTITQLEVLLGNGNIIRTGFGHWGEEPLTHVYRHGIGPSLDGLFFQSNFGIVLSATVLLQPKPETISSFLIHIQSEEKVPDLCEALQKLMMSGDLNCITHIFNQERFIPGLAPHIFEYYQKIKQPKTHEEVENLLRSQFPTKWLAAGNIKGDQAQVRHLKKKLKNSLSPFGKVMVITDSTKKIFSVIQRFPGLHFYKALLYAQKPVGEMTTGQPTYGTLGAIHWPIAGYVSDPKILKNPDTGVSGYIYSLPFAPLNKTSAQKLIEISESTGKLFGFQTAITLNLVSHRILEAVVSLSFDRKIKDQVQQAKSCIRQIQDQFIKEGFYPYRIHIDYMDQVVQTNSLHWKMIQDLKNQFDPDGVISPGRYCFSSIA